MVESFGVGENGGGEAAVSLWSGVVAASFFLAQFLTALLWVSVANKHGRRVVLFASLVGNGITVILFGASKNLGSAITTRLALGLFNGLSLHFTFVRYHMLTRASLIGAVGVARSAVTDVTDDSNRPKAYNLVGERYALSQNLLNKTLSRMYLSRRSNLGSRRYCRKCSRRSTRKSRKSRSFLDFSWEVL